MVNPLRCLIVDDEPLARQLLEAHLRQVPGLVLAASCSSAVEAFPFLFGETVDLLFLDINMPGIDGVSFLRSLKHPPRTIFTTAYAEHAVEAFELDAADYLLKPITFERFLKAVQKVLPAEPVQQPTGTPAIGPDEAFFIKVNKRLLRIPFDEILYLEGLGDYLKLFTAKETHVSYLTLSRAEELLPSDRFLRVHKSYMIHLRKIDFIEGSTVRIGAADVPVGATYREGLLQRVGQG